MAKNDDTCACCTCGYEWKRGLHGGHSCSDTLLIKVKSLNDHVTFLEKQLDTARVDAITSFGAELVNEHESSFAGGENQIAAICQVVNEQINKPVCFANKGYSEANMQADNEHLDCIHCGGSGHKDDAEYPRLTGQQLADCGLNPFAIKLLGESIVDANVSSSVRFKFNNVGLTIEPTN